MAFRSPRVTCDAIFDAKHETPQFISDVMSKHVATTVRLRSSYQTLCRNTWRRRWRSETVASNPSHFESHAMSKRVATTLTSGAPGRKTWRRRRRSESHVFFPGSAAVAAGQSVSDKGPVSYWSYVLNNFDNALVRFCYFYALRT